MKVCVHASEAAETAGPGSEPSQVRDQYPPVIPHYHIGYIAAPRKNQGYLSLDLKGDGGYLPQQFSWYDIVTGYPPSVESLQVF